MVILTIITALLLGVGGVVYAYRPSVSHADTPTIYLYTPQVILKLINEERARNGSKSLVMLPELNQGANLKLQDMIKNGYFGHIDKNGKHGYEYIPKICSRSSENLTGGINPVDAWIASPPHQKAQIDPLYDAVGIASGTNILGQHYYVAHFCTLNY